MPYSPTTWVLDSTPHMNAANLNKLRNELSSQAAARGVSHTLPTFADGAAPFLTDAFPFQEMERVARLVAASLGIGAYEETKWFPGWEPARNAVNLNRLETQAVANRAGIDALGSGHPAGYFTGPLGANNVLPATATGALLSLWSGGSGQTTTEKITRMESLQTSAGRAVDLVGAHFAGGGTYQGFANCAFTTDTAIIEWAHTNGSVPLVTWTPNRATSNNDSVVRQIINGERDGCIDAIADLLAGYGYRIMLRPFHEFDFLQYHRKGDATLDYTTTSSQGQAIIDGWQHMVERFAARGASKVGFFWCPDEGGGSREMVGFAYPGNSYVDWVGSDRYNHASTGTFSGCQINGWVDFYRIFNHTTAQCGGQQNYHDRFAVANEKPFVIGETSTRYDDVTTTRKGTWYSDVAKAKDSADTTRYMSNLAGVTVFDQFVSEENNSDWRIDSNQTAAMAEAGTLGTFSQPSLDGWVTWSADAKWNVGVLGGAT